MTLDIGDGKTLVAIVTLAAAKDIGFSVGDRACALVDASHIILAAN
ncbi:TOBE domain-containing protein [Azospirillum palustre]|nr:TOBE domain-containing protein [Azospirillum palustre]